MKMYEVSVEAQGFGDPEGESEKLLESLGDYEELQPKVLVNDQGGLALQFGVEAVDGLDAHDVAMEVWGQIWSTAFDGRNPNAMALKCIPVRAATSNGAAG